MPGETGQEAAHGLAALVARRVGVALADVILLKRAAHGAVFRARIGAVPVIVKQFRGDDPAQTVTRLKAELDHLAEVFGDGPFRANRCLHAWPEIGIAVLSIAPGTRLDLAIARASGDARAELLRQSGAWLAAYASGRRRAAAFGPRHWLRKLDGQALEHVHTPADRAHLAALRAALNARLPTLRGIPVTRAAVHGDFAGINLHVYDGVIHGFDIQGEIRMPLARAAARFLVWLQIHDDAGDFPRRFGIRAEDWEAFLSSGVLSPREAESTLPFFTGVELHTRFVESYRRRRLRGNARRAIAAFCAEDW